MSNLEPPNPPNREPSPAPETEVAKDFSSQLDAFFGLSPEVSGLSQSVEDKRLTISQSSRELQELEARIKAAESKLQKVGGANTTTASNGTSASTATTQQQSSASTSKQPSAVSASAQAQAAADAAAQNRSNRS